MPALDPAALSASLAPGPDGIWVPRGRAGRQAESATLSYPQEGNLNCLALEAGSFWFAHRSDCILALARRFPPPGPLLDVGGGNGYVALALQRAGISAALLEPGEQGARSAYRRGVRPVICSTLEEAGFYPGSLGAVGLFDVLEHIQDERAFLAQVRGLLAPGGRVYLTVPAYRLLWSADDDYAGHYRRYTRGSLARSLASAGLAVEFSSYFFSMLPAPILLLRALPSRLGLRKQNAWDSYRREHSAPRGLAGSLLGRLLRLERARLERGGSLPLGASCLAAARKP